jgi:hypothetical protein
MELEALPLTILIILVEFALGSLIAVLISDARGLAPGSFVKLSAALVVIAAALALLTATGVSGDEAGGYDLREGLFVPLRALIIAFLALSLVYAWLTFRDQREASLNAGALAMCVGLAVVGIIAYQISAPTWSLAGTVLSLLAGTLALGFASESMILGHWYLVTPKLPGRPLVELTFLLLVVLAVQAALMVLNAAVPATDVPETSAVLSGSLGSNPAFWLRVGVGLVFPIVLAYMAWRSSREDAMMSATGLLYIAVGAVFAGEVLARGLLFVTASPV